MNGATAILTLLLSLIGLVRPGRPCSIPDYVEVVPSGGIVPANMPGIDVFGEKCPDLRTLPVVKQILPDGGEVAVLLTGAYPRFQFVGELAANSGFSVEYCSQIDRTFSTSGPSPFPEGLGVISFVSMGIGPLVVPEPAVCSASRIVARAELSFEPSSDIGPWLPYVDFTLKIAGQPWGFPLRDLYAGGSGLPPLSWQQRTRFIPYAVCDKGADASGVQGLPPGTYSAVLYGRLPGTNELLSTPPVSFTLSCEENVAEAEPSVEEVVEPIPEPDVEDVVERDGAGRGDDSGRGCAGGGSSPPALMALLGFTVICRVGNSVVAQARRRHRAT